MNIIAPNYRHAEELGQSCDTCSHFDTQTNYCKKYAFKAEPHYTCDAWVNINEQIDKLSMLVKKANLGLRNDLNLLKNKQPPQKPLQVVPQQQQAPQQNVQQQQAPQQNQQPNNILKPSVVQQIAPNTNIGNVQGMFTPKSANVTQIAEVNPLQRTLANRPQSFGQYFQQNWPWITGLGLGGAGLGAYLAMNQKKKKKPAPELLDEEKIGGFNDLSTNGTKIQTPRYKTVGKNKYDDDFDVDKILKSLEKKRPKKPVV